MRDGSRTIPVILVAGFLGSGKTTLLNHILKHNRGARIGVVVNDFGAVNVDSMLVAGQVDSMVSLGNGCLCCAVDVEDLDALFETLTGTDLDAIVVEASGLAEPRTLIRLVLGSENKKIRYGGLVTVVDAAEFDATSAKHPEITAHLPLADLVVLNKTDRRTPSEIADLTTALLGSGVDAPVLPTAQGVVDVGLLLDFPELESSSAVRQLTLDDLLREDDEDHSGHMHTTFDSVAFTSPDPVDPRSFVDFLEQPPTGLYRTKGFVDFGRGRFLVQTVGRHIRFERIPSRGGARGTELVLIGTGIDPGDIRTRLSSMVRAERADDSALLVVHRYVV